MPRLAALLALALAAPACAQKPFGIEESKPSRTLKEAMLAQLADPKVQVALGVTGTQRSLQETRLAAATMDAALDLMRATVAANDTGGSAAFSAKFSQSPAKALYPFLSDAQLARLRRLTLKDQPLNSLTTDEVAFALTLTAAQRRAVDALYARQAKAVLNPRLPSVRVLTAAMKRISADSAKFGESGGDDGVTVEKIDAIRPAFAALFRAIEQSTRLRAKEPSPKLPDPLALLTAPQRRRYRELAAATVATLPAPRLVAARLTPRATAP